MARGPTRATLWRWRPVIFNSLVFLEFAVVFFLLWFFVRRMKSGRYIFLIGASCIFYSYAGWWFVPLLLATASFDFWLARMIADHPDKKKVFLALTLMSNLGVLGLLKYAGFFADSINSAAGLLGSGPMLPVMQFILPVGISFYTFQSLS